MSTMKKLLMIMESGNVTIPRREAARAARREELLTESATVDSDPEYWPMFCDSRHHPEYSEELDNADSLKDATHPVVAAFNPAAVESLKVVHEWDDDHLPCVAVQAVVAGVTYKWADCWLTRAAEKMYYRAECDSPEQAASMQSQLKVLTKHIKQAGC